MNEPDLTDPAIYRHWLDERVRFSDTDVMGHLNNVGAAAMVESGRVAYGMSLATDLGSEDRGIILRRLEIDYLAEVHYPASVRVGSCLVALGRTSFTVGTGLFVDERCVATSRGVLVVVGSDGPVAIAGADRERLESELPR